MDLAASFFTVFTHFYNAESYKTVDSIFDLLILHKKKQYSPLGNIYEHFAPSFFITLENHVAKASLQ